MSDQFREIREMLLKKNLRPSHHRIKILQYLIGNREHPTAEQVFRDLHRESPALSKATVYNTLKALTEVLLVRIINIEDKELRYDIVLEPHGHFKCRHCGRIFNFQVDIDGLAIGGLEGFEIEDKNVYFKGACSGCRSDKKINEQGEKR